MTVKGIRIPSIFDWPWPIVAIIVIIYGTVNEFLYRWAKGVSHRPANLVL
jgi:hypothetical protein